MKKCSVCSREFTRAGPLRICDNPQTFDLAGFPGIPRDRNAAANTKVSNFIASLVMICSMLQGTSHFFAGGSI
jgi:hypothetical protein